ASSSSSSPNSSPCRKGATIRWPEEYGNLFSSAKACEPRCTTSRSSASPAAARQKTHPFCSSADPMYSRRHGAHSGFVTPTLLPVFSDAHAPARLARGRPHAARGGLGGPPLLGRDRDPDA